MQFPQLVEELEIEGLNVCDCLVEVDAMDVGLNDSLFIGGGQMNHYLYKLDHLKESKDNLSPSIEARVKQYFEAFSRNDVFEHTRDVSAVYDEILTMMNVSDLIRKQGKVAVLLHDVGRVVDYSDIVAFCESNGKPVSQSELKALGILHQFASKIIAK